MRTIVGWHRRLSVGQKLLGFAGLCVAWMLLLVAVGYQFWGRIQREAASRESLWDVTRQLQQARLAEKSYLQFERRDDRLEAEQHHTSIDQTLAALDQSETSAISRLLFEYRESFTRVVELRHGRRKAGEEMTQSLDAAEASVSGAIGLLVQLESERQMEGETLDSDEREMLAIARESLILILRLQTILQQFLLTADRAEVAAFEELVSGSGAATLESLRQFARVLGREDVQLAAERVRDTVAEFSGRSRAVQKLFEEETKAIAGLEASGRGVLDQTQRALTKSLAESAGTERILRATLFTASLLGTILFLLLAVGLVRSLTRPIARLVAAAEQLSEGQLHADIEIRSEDEIGRLGRAVARLASALRSQVSAIQRASGTVSDGAQQVLGTPNHVASTVREQVAAVAQVRRSERAGRGPAADRPGGGGDSDLRGAEPSDRAGGREQGTGAHRNRGDAREPRGHLSLRVSSSG